MKRLLIPTSTLLLLSLTGCGGSSSDTADNSATDQTGYFVDAGVKGVSYTGSAGSSGITGDGGSFSYKTGEKITFKLGGVTLGEVNASKLVSPVDFGSANTKTNLVRFLITLDSDGNASNGITIDSTTQSLANNWKNVNFDLAPSAFNTNVSSEINASFANNLVTTTAADNHLLGSLQCAYSGGYLGTWSGTDSSGAPVSGTLGIMVNANGSVYTAGKQNNDPTVFYSTGGAQDPLTKKTTINGVVIGATSTTFESNATFESVDKITGSYSVVASATLGGSGTLTATRVGSSATAVYRFTGMSFESTDPTVPSGVFTIDIDASGSVTGGVYDMETNSVSVYLSGTISGNSLTNIVLKDSAGTQVGSITAGTVDLANGTLSGVQWTQGSFSGTVTGSGCRLN
ncbi:MAG: hypothetical protein FAF05_01005 [Epsilonproteobacteria bacterium]|nr:hypothetical protein [Campylobacterota bacterium]